MDANSKTAPLQDIRFSGLKEVQVSKLIVHLDALQKMVGSKPSITPVFLVNRKTGGLHEESFMARDWFLSYGLHKNIRVGYKRKLRGNNFDVHVEEYDLGEFPYRVFVMLDQPLPELPPDTKRKKRPSKQQSCKRR